MPYHGTPSSCHDFASKLGGRIDHELASCFLKGRWKRNYDSQTGDTSCYRTIAISSRTDLRFHSKMSLQLLSAEIVLGPILFFSTISVKDVCGFRKFPDLLLKSTSPKKPIFEYLSGNLIYCFSKIILAPLLAELSRQTTIKKNCNAVEVTKASIRLSAIVNFEHKTRKYWFQNRDVNPSCFLFNKPSANQ